ncbi:MAG: hypothetical protein Q4C61_06535 [Lachnospiraceae bacterium]|nr:hypothetical protein [Lachnospiraceae bacterium]
MKKRSYNTMGQTRFVTEHIIWALIAMIWYKNLLFRCVKGFSLIQSKQLLWGMVAACSAAGILLERKRRRNAYSVTMNLLIAYGGYTALAYRDVRPELVALAFFPAATFSFWSIAATLGIRIRDGRLRKGLFKRLLNRELQLIQTACAAGMAAMLLVLGAGVLFGSAVLRPSGTMEMAVTTDAQNISNSMDTVLLLQEKEWRELSVKERLDVLQTAANIERTYLGLPHELNVGAANLDESLLGYYNDNTHEIILNLDQISETQAYELLETVCHEAYHAYQHRLVDAYNGADARTRGLRMFKKAGRYAEEFGSYIDGTEDFCGYYDQECENDAREYAEKAVCDYYDRIFEYLEENGEEEKNG